MGRPKRSENRDTRQDILDRSLELFATHGFTGSSMRDIARAVGVRESALYHHFPNKDAILRTVLESTGPGAINTFLGADMASLAESVGVREFLKNIGETMLTLWSTPRERHFLRVLMAEMPRLKQAGIIDPQVQVMKIRARIAEVFAALSARGLIREADPLTTAMRFMGPMLFLRLAYLSDITTEPDLPSMRADLARHLDSFWETVKPVAATLKEKRR